MAKVSTFGHCSKFTNKFNSNFSVIGDGRAFLGVHLFKKKYMIICYIWEIEKFIQVEKEKSYPIRFLAYNALTDVIAENYKNQLILYDLKKNNDKLIGILTSNKPFNYKEQIDEEEEEEENEKENDKNKEFNDIINLPEDDLEDTKADKQEVKKKIKKPKRFYNIIYNSKQVYPLSWNQNKHNKKKNYIQSFDQIVYFEQSHQYLFCGFAKNKALFVFNLKNFNSQVLNRNNSIRFNYLHNIIHSYNLPHEKIPIFKIYLSIHSIID